jgi:hypothetical protein
MFIRTLALVTLLLISGCADIEPVHKRPKHKFTLNEDVEIEAYETRACVAECGYQNFNIPNYRLYYKDKSGIIREITLPESSLKAQ